MSGHPLLAGVSSLLFYGASQVRDVTPWHAGSQVLLDPDLGISSVGAVDLRLMAQPNPVAPHQTLTLGVHGGMPLYPVVLALTGANGGPMQPVILFNTLLDANGRFGLAVPVPVGLSGLRLDFVAASLNDP